MLDAPATTEGHRMSYTIVEPERFTEEQQAYIERFARTIEVGAAGSGVIAGIKDVRSLHLTATDPYGTIVGLPRGKDVAGRMDHDMPCEGTAAFADCFVREDRSLLDCGDAGAMKSVLNIHRYETGLDALVFDKFLLKHRPSSSVLGIVYCAYQTDLSRFTTLFPEYWSEFGLGCSLDRTQSEIIDGIGKFSGIEYEVAFLLALGHKADAIKHFLRRWHPKIDPDVGSALFGITEMMATAGIPIQGIRDRLIEAGVHQRIPSRFFDKVVAAHP